MKQCTDSTIYYFEARSTAAVNNTSVDELSAEIEALKIQISSFQEKEQKWKKRWQQIAYHIRQKGIQMIDIDKPVHPVTVLPSHTTTEKILRELDKEIPPSGRV